jgi:sortase A
VPTDATRSGPGRLLRGAGITCALVGLLLGAFWAYLQWGTGAVEHGAQARLGAQLEHRRVPAVGRPVARSAPTAYRWPAVADGAPIARLLIPSIGLDQVVVQGTETADLREGPGHYPGTPYPGQQGNVAIAGHRTTYAHPFYDLDGVAVGALIHLVVPGRTWTYRAVGSVVVPPDDVAVAGPLGEAGGWLTLTTCNPRYSAASRLVVRARLVGSPARSIVASEPVVSVRSPPPGATGAGRRLAIPRPAGAGGTWWSVVEWVGAGVVVALVGRRFVRSPRARPARFLAGAVAMAVLLPVLYELFGSLAVRLPAGY